jgi:hypothetical protein
MMLPLIPAFLLAQNIVIPVPPPELPQPSQPSQDIIQTPREILVPQTVRPLPGQVDSIPVFNSNSPELLFQGGILLSTFPPGGKINPAAHLNYAFQGRFDIFTHHVARAITPENPRSLYLGVLLYNPSDRPVTINILEAANHRTQPEAPFNVLPPMVDDPVGNVFSGPGSRLTGDILRDRRQATFPAQLVIQPRESRMLINMPISLRSDLQSNGQSAYIRLNSDGKVYIASLALPADADIDGNEREPTINEWENLILNGNLATPRDMAPTPLDQPGKKIYGRVAGVAQGSQWTARMSDPGELNLNIPAKGQAYSYGISTLNGGTLGTNQVQSAPMIVRYPDTAYKSHGNYGLQYHLTFPLFNPTTEPQTITLALQTPIKEDQPKGGLRFLVPPPKQVFFRGTVQVGFENEIGLWRNRFVHLVQQRGDQGSVLLTLTIPAGFRRLVQVDLIYPPDSTPPQVITITTLNQNAARSPF